MGKSMPEAPEPPDPYATARAQTGTNVNTAIANTWLQNADEFSPLGTIDYSRTGTETVRELIRDKDGNSTGQYETYQIPTFTRRVNLSPEEQSKLAASQNIQLDLLGMGKHQIGAVGRSLGLQFNPTSYLAANPDVANAQKLVKGGEFNAESYLKANPDVAAARYMAMGTEFDPKLYLERNPGLQGVVNEQNALTHWTNFGESQGWQPGFRMEEKPVDALRHWQEFGQKEGRQGSGTEDRYEPMDPLEHWLTIGQFEGRQGSGLDQASLIEDLPAAVNTIGGEQDNAARMKAVEDALYARLNPQLERDRAALDVQLTNEGFNRGTEAYDKAMDEFNRQANDARLGVLRAGGEEDNRLFAQNLQRAMFANTSRERALQERLVNRQTPLNELTAMLGLSQVNMPQFTPYQSGNIANTPVGDYVYRSADIEQRNYAAQTAAAAQQNAAMFSAGASLIGGLFKMSDRRLKRDIELLGELRPGVGWYRYRFNWSDDVHEGVMADEVERVIPEAVVTRAGVQLVDYGAL